MVRSEQVRERVFQWYYVGVHGSAALLALAFLCGHLGAVVYHGRKGLKGPEHSAKDAEAKPADRPTHPETVG